jgi:hypothetical protein
MVERTEPSSLGQETQHQRGQGGPGPGKRQLRLTRPSLRIDCRYFYN